MCPVTSQTQSPAPDGRRPAVAYIRRSTDRQEQSLDDQRAAIQTYADGHGFEIQDWHQDDAVSGASAEAREAFQKMLSDIVPEHFRYPVRRII